MPPNAGRLPSLLARCQIWINSQAEASRDSAMRGAPLHVYYIQLGQYTHPMGSSRPPWAAGEYVILYSVYQTINISLQSMQIF